MKRNAYQLYNAIEARLKGLSRIEEQLDYAEHKQEASDVRWSCILLETALSQLSKKIGRNANSSRRREPA